jgi:hypothetical protein
VVTSPYLGRGNKMERTSGASLQQIFVEILIETRFEAQARVLGCGLGHAGWATDSGRIGRIRR